MHQPKLHEWLELALEKLPPAERQVISMRYGLHGYSFNTLAVVGKAMKYTKERVRQIQNKALRKLKLAAKSDKYFDQEWLKTAERIYG